MIPMLGMLSGRPARPAARSLALPLVALAGAAALAIAATSPADADQADTDQPGATQPRVIEPGDGPGLAGDRFAERLAVAERQADLLAFDRFSNLALGEIVTVDDLPIEGGESITLELERISVLAPGAEIIEVDAQGVERAAGPQQLVLLRGIVRGDLDSTVVLGVSPDITNGHIEAFGSTRVITTGPVDADAGGLPISIAPLDDIRFEAGQRPGCGYDPTNPGLNAGLLPEEIVAGETKDEGEGSGNTGAREGDCRIALIAIDTDFEYTSRLFNGNTAAAAAYTQTLIAAISEIYERDFGVRLLVSYLRTFSANNDPYTNSGDALDQLVSAWQGGQGGYAQRTVVHLLSGRTNLPYGGVAYLSGLCSGSTGFGVSAYLNASFPYPLTDFSFSNWDLVVVAHELGHNFGTGHTHDGYTPVIDRCGIDCTGNRTSTIMSYCHICSGGLSNIRLGFHPRVIDNVVNYLDTRACDLNYTSELAAIDDEARVFQGNSVDVDVIANDLFGGCSGMLLDVETFDTTSANGGTIEEINLPGTLRPLLRYTPPAGFGGVDTFSYTATGGLVGNVSVTVELFKDPAPVDSALLSPGLRFEFYQTDGTLTQLPDFDTLTPFSSWIVSQINFPNSSSLAAGSLFSDNVAALFEGYVFAEQAGVYTFTTSSNEGSRLYVGGQMVVDNDGLHNTRSISGQIGLQAGYHDLRVEYFEATGEASLVVSWEAPSGQFGVIESTSFFNGPECAADLTGEGSLDFFDVLAFLAQFDASDPAADLNNDGSFDFFDVLEYLSIFDAGC
ncbi:MAG: M12 family metallo-peptidase [Planctomycetota bacterium]